MGTDANQLAGEALDARVKELGIEGASSMSADEKRAAVAKYEEQVADLKNTVNLRTAYPIDRFEHGIEGVPAITSEGTIVPASKVEEITARAESAATALEKVG